VGGAPGAGLWADPRFDYFGAHRDDRGLALVREPALPRWRVQHGEHAVRRAVAARADPGELRPADLDDVLVPDADLRAQVPVAPGSPGHPDLVVDLGVRVEARRLVAVAMADEYVPDARHPEHVQVLGGVGREQRDPRARQREVHQVDQVVDADDGQAGPAEQGDQAPL